MVTVNARRVMIETYRPSGTGPFPLVFMLHGSAGAFTPKRSAEPAADNFGEKTLARNCFAVVLPHYLEAIGQKSITSEREIKARFPELLDAVSFLLSNAETARWVKRDRVFLYGESLGGYLSVALALRRDEISAVSEFSGGMPHGYVFDRPGTPRVLISHGEADALVSVSEAVALYSYLKDHGIPAEIDLYPNEGHYLSKEARQHVLSRTIELFDGCLKNV